MRFHYKKSGIIMLVFCLMFSSRIIFAQGITEQKRDIYSKLGDQSCKTMPLDKCFCPAAKEMQAYVDALIETGVNKEEIFYKVAKKFTINAILDKEVKANAAKRLSREFGAKRPQIFLELDSFDFGKVSRKQGALRKKIKVFNKGKEELVVKNIKATCSCTTAALTVGKNQSPYFGNKGSEPGWQEVIGPNKSAEVEYVLDLTTFTNLGIPSKVKRDILITSNDPIYPEVKFSGTAEIVE